MTDLSLVIGNYNYSTWSMRPWVLLTAFDLPFTSIVESLAGPDLTRRLKTYSPSGRVPVLRDGTLTVWDSLAICEHVSEQHLNGRGWPSAIDARAYARSVAAEMHSGFGALRSEMPMNIRAQRRITPSEACWRDIAQIEAIWQRGRAAFADAGPWLAGEFSIADAMFAPVVMRFATYGVVLDGLAEDYAERLRHHPAVLAWIERAKQESEIVPEDEAGDPIE